MKCCSAALASAAVVGLWFGSAPGSAVADTLTPLTFIPVPADQANVQPGGAFSSFDISFADAVTGNVYIADRSNASIDIFSGTSLTFLGRATGFTGQQATTSLSGADGVLTVTSGGITTIYGGNGDSTLRVYNATTANPGSPTFITALSTGGAFRLDEMAYSPVTQQIIAANNADAPAYATLFSTTGGHPPVAVSLGPITVPMTQVGIALGGMEQPAWNPTTNTFFVSIPELAGSNNPGGVSQISTGGTVLSTISFANLGIGSCSPTGLAVGGGGNMLVGCGNVGTQAILLKPDGTIIKTIPGLSGTDEVWYDPTTKKFYVTGNNGSNTTRFFDVVDENGNILQTINLPATTSAHSITVDPLTGDVFVALAGTSALNPCPTSLGCIEVFGPTASAETPLPGTLPLFATGLGALSLLGWRRKKKAEALAA
jgi:hypothetical protein